MTTVHSYHINVDHGDSAIHLLLNTNTTPKQVLGAVLIDGGKPGHIAEIGRVIQGIRQSPLYDCTLQGNDTTAIQTMRFDAIVITHWDIDHWGGIRELLTLDMVAQLQPLIDDEVTKSETAFQTSKTTQFGTDPILPSDKKKWNEYMQWIVDATPTIKAPWDTIQSASHRVAFQSRFMKYAPAGFPTTTALVQDPAATAPAPAVTAATLLTTFYCPYSYTTANVGTQATFNGDNFSFFQPTFGAAYTPGSTNTNMMSLFLLLNYTLKVPKPVKSDSGAFSGAASTLQTTYLQMWNIVNVCRLRADFDSYLGVELFHNVAPPQAWGGLTSPTALAASHYSVATSPFRTQMIGMFIVSGDQKIIGQTALTMPDTPPAIKPTGPWDVSGGTVHTQLKLISSRGSSSSTTTNAPLFNIVDSSSSSDQNRHKVPLIRVINSKVNRDGLDGTDGCFSGTPAQRGTPEELNSPSIGCVVLQYTPTANVAHILHYTAGDALYDTESSIANWLTDNGANPLSIPVMKLSHHGASESTPLRMLALLNPRNVISSHGVGTFGHPRYEVICALLGFAGSRRTDVDPKPITLWCTNYPYWLKDAEILSTTLQLDAFLPTTVQTDYPQYRFHKQLDALFATTNILNDVWQSVKKIDYVITEHDKLAGFANSMKAQMLTALRLVLKPEFEKMRAPALTDTYSVGAICVQFDAVQLVSVIQGDGQRTSNSAQVERKSISSSRKMSKAAAEAAWQDQLKDDEKKKKAEDKKLAQLRYAARCGNVVMPNEKPRDQSSSSSSTTHQSTTKRQMDQANDEVYDLDDEGDHTSLDDRSKRSRKTNKQPDDKKGGEKLVRLQGPSTPKVGIKAVMAKAVVGASNGTPTLSVVYICGSILDISTTAGAYGLDSNASASFNSFLNSMRPLRVSLEDTPTSAGVMLTQDDEWFNYLQSNTLGITSVKLSGSLTTTTAPVQSTTFLPSKLEVGLQLAGIQFTFSTTSTGNVMSASGAKSSPTAFNDAIDGDQNVLILGLQTTASTLTTSQVLDIIDPPWLTKASGFPVLGNALTFELDPTSPGSRCALFLSPDANYPVWLRLQFKVKAGSGAISDALNFLSKHTTVTFGDTYLYCVRSAWSTYSLASNSFLGFSEMAITLQASVTVSTTFKFDVWLHFKSDVTQLVLTFDDLDVADVLDYITKNLFDDLVSPASLIPMAKNLKIRRVILNMSSGTSGFGIDGMSLTMQIDAFGAIFFSTFSWPSFRIDAILWTPSGSNATLQDLYLLPGFETYQQLVPLTIAGGSEQTANISLTSTVVPSSAPAPPQSIGTHINSVRFTAWKDPTGMRLSFQGSMSAGALGNPSTPTLELGDLTILADRFPGTTVGAQAEYAVSLSTTIYLFPRNYDTDISIDPARFAVAVLYNSGNWTVSGSATDLQFALLYDLFDGDSKGSVMDVMHQISIPYLQCTWSYIDGSSTLHVEGALLVHTLELKLAYDYDSAGKEWTFQAQLGTVSNDGATKITIVDLIRDFDPDSEVAAKLDEVPFIRDIALPTVNTTPGSFGDAPIQLLISNKGGATVMWFQIEIETPAGKLSFLFVQYQPNSQGSQAGGGTGRTTGGTTTAAKPKRLLRIRLDSLPSLPSVPIVGQINDPVDSLEYILVRDVTGESKIASGGKAGFTLAEVQVINADLHPDNQLRYRDIQSSNPGSRTGTTTATNNAGSSSGGNDAAKTKYVLLDGHHFIVVAEGKVILDHLFGASKGTSSSPTPNPNPNSNPLGANHAVVPRTATAGKTVVVGGGGGAAAAGGGKGKALMTRTETTTTPPIATSAAEEDSGSTMGPLRKSLGPLSIANFGLQCKDNHLWLLVDATITLGPLQFTLIGFGIGIPLTVQVDEKSVPISFSNLSHLDITSFQFRLSGLSVYFSQPPVLIAGMFEKLDTATFEAYRGGLAISISEYTILAVGSYQHTFSPDFKSTFVFGRLDGPILSLEFAEISGLELGFGQNYDLTMPAVSEVLDFPLVHGVSATNDPMVLLASNPDGTAPDKTSFLHWTTPKQNQYWFALGVRVDSFQILTIDAAMVFAFGANTLKISIVGMASVCFPPVEGNVKPPEAFLYAEFGIIAAIDVLGGSVWVGAQLTPNSYVLCPFCHISGGFALAYWFYPSATAGDFVFTIGGYHPAFRVPAHYPACDRVGVSWQVSDCITAGGHAYFAITPKMAMAGGDLEFVFRAGPFYASFTAWANFLFIFKPFFMIGEIGCSVEAGFRGSIGLIHFNVHAEVDADLMLQGPPWAGRLRVHLWICSFSVDFGDLGARPPFLPWEDFLVLVQKPGPGSDATAGMVVLALQAGNLPQKTTDAVSKSEEKWFVRAGTFKCRLECKIPIDKLEYDDGHDNTAKTFASNKGPIYANPMGEISPLTSTVTVRIVAADGASHPRTKIENPWILSEYVKSVPRALWDQYNDAQNPLSDKFDSGDSLSPGDDTSKKQISRLVGYSFETPNPRTPETPATALQFNAFESMSEDVFQNEPGHDENPILHATAPVQKSNLPAAMTRGTADGSEYTTVEDTWGRADFGVTQMFADVWKQAMKWDKAAELTAKKPTQLLGEFETLYLSCPWVMATS